MPRTRELPRVLYFPGLGADWRLFRKLQASLEAQGYAHAAEHFYNQAPRRGETLSAYAARAAQEQGFAGQSYELVIAMSLGGMLAQELFAQGQLRAKKLALISTACHPRELSRVAALLAWLSKYAPRSAILLFKRFAGWFYPRVRVRNLNNREEIGAMLLDTENDLLAYGGGMILGWRGLVDPAALPERRIRIHGDRDPVIHCARARESLPIDSIHAGGDHVIIVARPERIAREIRAGLQLNERKPRAAHGDGAPRKTQRKATRTRSQKKTAKKTGSKR